MDKNLLFQCGEDPMHQSFLFDVDGNSSISFDLLEMTCHVLQLFIELSIILVHVVKSFAEHCGL